MSPLDAVGSVYGNYFNFGGRARRSEYWWFVVFFVVIAFVASFLSYAIGGRGSALYNAVVAGLSILYLLTFIPLLALSVRRLHDIDRSGWWLLLSFIPFIGSIILFVWSLMDGTRGPNSYGPDPKGRPPAGYGYSQSFPQQWGPPGQPPPGQPPSW